MLTTLPTRDGGQARYEQLVERAVVIYQIGGVGVRPAALSDIIASKEWADRPKDRAALDELRTIASRTDQ